MPTQPEYTFNFTRGLHTDGGPFFAEKGYYRDVKNAIHQFNGGIENRPGIELLDQNKIEVIDEQSDATNIFLNSLFFAEVTKSDGTRLNCIFLRNGKRLRIYCNDGSTYTNSLENLDIFNPDFDFILSDVSAEALYYKTKWTHEGNTVVMTNPRSPIYKVHWYNDTFNLHKIQLLEVNEDLYDTPAAKSRAQSMAGWYSIDIPMKTSTTSYVIDQFFAEATMGAVFTVYKYSTSGVSTKVDPADFTIVEVLNSEINLVTLTLTYTTATTGDTLRIYIGRTLLTDQDSALSTDQIVVSNQNKDYAADDSFAPGQTMLSFGRAWFAGMEGPIDSAQEATIAGYGSKYKKIWVSELFTPNLNDKSVVTMKCGPARGPFDIQDSELSPTDGGIIDPDNAGRIKALASYQTHAVVAASNGVWVISGRDAVFSFLQMTLNRAIDTTIDSSEPLVSTDNGVFVTGEHDIYQLFPSKTAGEEVTSFLPPMLNLVRDKISQLYRSIPKAAREQSFLRYDRYNSRVYFFYPDVTTGNKYKVSGSAQKFLIYDLRTKGWTGNGDITEGTWSIQDMITVPADSYFTSSDSRFPKKQVNLVVLSRKNGAFTDITFGILEGKNYCADYYDTTYKAAFESYVDSFNSFAPELGVLRKKQVFRLYVAMKRTEDAAAVSGFYEFPGAVYLSKRVHFADHSQAGPWYSYTYNTGTNTWDANAKQIYFPNKIGSTVVGGGKPPYEAVIAKLKVAGKGVALALRFGNKFNDTSLTGTIQEQEKPWALYGYHVELKGYS